MGKVTRQATIKIFELILVCILMGLHSHSFAGDQHIEMISMTTFGGYLVILVGLLIGIFRETPVDRSMGLFFTIIGFVLFIITGALNVDYFDRLNKSQLRDIGLSKGSLSIIQGIIFLIDAIITYRET
ncbi:hypothetical protein HN011_008068 [Eciton burchellii]|nr:hypothetical protein HN011_008068 [Eciton burchellii]